eukprot:TRINITY_DN12702_c0_g1_i1.p1 TRINITY_DN12702_c0_g1~~TRINITY_DN12702_c0_g1_i1.p1  ORF type:complete len:476 (+),score=75.76 TRINITY_DN12702_c0_g1_i1:53-1480(+)
MNCSTIESCNASMVDLQGKLSDMNGAYDVFWVLMSMILVFFMQSGFAMLEAGTVRRMNVSNILFKNAFDPVLAAVVWWICGWGFAMGHDASGIGSDTVNGFIGNGDFFLVSDGEPHDPSNYHSFVFQWAFCATAATIVSGAIAERCYIVAYFVYGTLLCGFIYPVVVHWVWSDQGFLSATNTEFKRINHGLIDFAGSGVVHMVGGFSALAGAYVVGPRKTWNSDAKYVPHDKTLVALGTLILWFGWFGFNCGSTLGLSGDGALVAGKVGATTVLGAAGGGMGVLIMNLVLGQGLLFDPVCNGILGGLVSITAGCSVVEAYAAVIIGLIGGVVYYGSSMLVTKMGVDDVLEASAVHGFCGFWGLTAVGFFATHDNVNRAYGSTYGDDRVGVFYGGNGKQLGTQMLAGAIILTWSLGLSLILFMVLKLTDNLRVPEWVEKSGLDNSEHGASAFSKSFQWVGTELQPKEEQTEPIKSE